MADGATCELLPKPHRNETNVQLGAEVGDLPESGVVTTEYRILTVLSFVVIRPMFRLNTEVNRYIDC